METRQKPSNRTLLIVLMLLHVLIISMFSYTNWQADPLHHSWWMVVVNALILSIPLVLLFGSIYVLVSARQQRRIDGQVSPGLARFIHKAPRIAAITIIFFTSLFSLDMFGTGAPLLEQIGGFLIHSIPSIIMIIFLLIAWKRPALGFYAFMTAAILFALQFVRDIESLPNLLLFVFPLVMVALLFYADWKWLAPIEPVEPKI